MRKINSDPINRLNYMIGTELRTNDNKIAKRVYEQYFNSKMKVEEQFDALEKVKAKFNYKKGSIINNIFTIF
jgi:hypothetical protein